MRNRGISASSPSWTNPRLAKPLQRWQALEKVNKFVSIEKQRNILLVLCCFLTFLLFDNNNDSNGESAHKTTILRNSDNNNNKCEMSFGSYRGQKYTTKIGGTVGTPKCLVESKWMQISQHSVKFPGSSSIIDDWLWIDYHDRINVLVEGETNSDGERQFLVFEQSKYALEGRVSLAVIGGIIEQGELPENAARREVEEEMNGLQCDNFHFLGRFRTDVNRGMGWVNSYLATNCSKGNNNNKQAPNEHIQDEVGVADTERQDLKQITLPELKESARKGAFLEVQWSATVALALLHEELMA